MAFSIGLRGDNPTQCDFQISKGKLVIKSGADAARDRIFTALSTQLGEWYLGTDEGVPYYGNDGSGILGGKMTQAEVAAILRRRILLDYEVNRINELSIVQLDRRGVSVSAEVLLKLTNGTSETMTIGI